MVRAVHCFLFCVSPIIVLSITPIPPNCIILFLLVSQSTSRSKISGGGRRKKDHVLRWGLQAFGLSAGTSLRLPLPPHLHRRGFRLDRRVSYVLSSEFHFFELYELSVIILYKKRGEGNMHKLVVWVLIWVLISIILMLGFLFLFCGNCRMLLSCICPCCFCVTVVVELALALIKAPFHVMQWFTKQIPC